MKYKRVLLKLSGEALAGEQRIGIATEMLDLFAQQIKELNVAGVEVAVVIGGGNIHRGVAGAGRGMDRTTSDHMGMLATVINSLALQDYLESLGVHTRVLSAIDLQKMAEPYIKRKAVRHLEKKRVVIFAAGTGNPYFTTDTAAALRANEIGADVLLKATKVDGVYDRDPVKFKDAQKYDRLTYIDVLKNDIRVMDATATSLCMENSIDIIVFDSFQQGNIVRVVQGETLGTLVTQE